MQHQPQQHPGALPLSQTSLFSAQTPLSDHQLPHANFTGIQQQTAPRQQGHNHQWEAQQAAQEPKAAATAFHNLFIGSVGTDESAGDDDAKAAPRVAGLFAEGRIETGGAQQMMLPEGTVLRTGDTAHVWKVGDGQIQKTAVKLGERDARSGEFPVVSGLVAGDRVLRSPASQLVDGQKFEFAKPVAAAAAGSAPN
jgi:hypothetical protein